MNAAGVNFMRTNLTVGCREFGRCWPIVVCLLLLGVGRATGAESVRKVDFREVPEQKELAEHARQVGNEMYPKILALLVEDGPKVPQQFDIVFKKKLWLRSMGEPSGYAKRSTVYLNANFFTKDPVSFDWTAERKNPTNLDIVLIHEMAHVVQHYRGWAPFYWTDAPTWCEEGIADYVRYKLGYTNGWSCPQCSTEYPHYTSGYWCAGAFLLYMDAKYGSNVVRQLNTELRRGSYSERFFVKATGRSLDGLWAEFQKTAAFTPLAAEINLERGALGFVNGRPPKNLAVRYETYLKQQPGGALALEAIEFLIKHGKSRKDLDAAFVAYVKQQPAGALTVEALEFLGKEKRKGRLPGWLRDEDGSTVLSMDSIKMPAAEVYPASRTLACRKKGDNSTYHYTVVRAAGDGAWKLQKAWRTGKDGGVIEEYSIP
jgi:hypothetical protein